MQFAGGMKNGEDAENNEPGNKKEPNQHSASTKSQTEPSRAGGHPSSATAVAPVFYYPLEQKFKEVEIKLDPWPHVREFRRWKNDFFITVAIGSGRGGEGMKWIRAVESASSIEDLSSHGPGWHVYSFT